MNHVAERPPNLIKPVVPAKPCSRILSDKRGVNLNQKIRLFEGLGQVPEDNEVEDNLAPLRRRQPKAVTPEQKRWTQIDTTENTSGSPWTAFKVPSRVGSGKQKTLPPTPPPKLLSPTSPSRRSPPAFVVQENKSVLNEAPKPKPRARSATPQFRLGEDCREGPNQTTTLSRPPPTLPIPYHKKVSDSIIYVPRHMMAYNRDNIRPRGKTQFDNGTYDKFIMGSIKEPQRPRASTDLANGRINEEQTDLTNGRTKQEHSEVRQSVLELALSFGELKTPSRVGSQTERPKTLGYPLKNGHSNGVMKSNPDLLSDHSDEQEESRSPQQRAPLGKLQRRLSRSLSDFDPVEMDQVVDTNKSSQVKSPVSPPRPFSTPPRPGALVPPPSKPKRTYDQDVYERSKVQSGLSPKVKLTQTQSAAPYLGRTVARPPSANARKKHYYEEVAIEEDVEGKDEKDCLLPSSTTSPDARNALVQPSKSSQDAEPTSQSSTRPVSALNAKNKAARRGKLQRSRRIERSHSSEDLILPKDYKISGEYADPGVVFESKTEMDKTKKKPEYSEPYMQRSSSDESLFKKPRVTIEDSEGYTVPGSHLWGAVPDDKDDKENKEEEEEEKKGIKLALQNLSGEKLISDENVNNSSPYKNRKVALRRRKNNMYARQSEDRDSCPPSPSFLSRRNTKTVEELECTSHFRQRSKHINMRHKIQSAFSRSKAAKVEEDSLSVTSEDSDVDVNDTVLKKRLTHVRAVRRRTSAYCSLEWYRKTMQYSKLYEYVVVVSLKFNKDTRRHEPCEIKRFPHEISDSHNDKLRAIPLFCFPDAFKWAKVEQYNSESYSFVLTSVDGSRLYGYNRRLLPPGDGPRLPEVYCVMSPIGCAPLYNELLDEIEKRRQVSMQAVEVLLRTARDNQFPRPGERMRIKMPIGENFPASITKPLIIHRPTDSRLEQMNFECLFDSLDVAKVIQVFASLLLERRVVMCSSKLSKLSSCSQAIAALLYPFAWQHVYVPVLPEKLIDMCCSPTPYIMGMLSLCIPRLDEMPGIDEVIVVDLDSRDFYFLVGDEETILPKKLYGGLQRALQFAEKGSSENINNLAETDPDQKNAMISEAFIHFFVETVGHYSNHFSHQYDGTLKFDRDGFLNAVRSRSTRRFLEVFTETQMFSLFIQEKETESEGICQGMFERRVKLFEREKAANATFSTKMKKIVKDSGAKIAETAKDVKAKVKLNMVDKV